MKKQNPDSVFKRLKLLFIGKARNIYDENLFHRLTLIAFFAWIGLGSDGLSSSCYGPEESFRILIHYPHLIIFVALAVVATIFIIGTSYSQIIRLFPTGGGGYIVATKLLSPKVGMVSGCSLLVDYILTISISVASGVDAIFSLLPPGYQSIKIFVAIGGISVLLLMNLRGTKESVFSLMPVFVLFVLTHIFVIIYALYCHTGEISSVYNDTATDFSSARQAIGLWGVLALLLRSYSMGAGTYTGLEAVSNSLPVLKDPKVKTGLTTMRYMTISLALTAFGLMLSYSLFDIKPVVGKTMNAVLLHSMTMNWSGGFGWGMVMITLFSEAALLFIGAQTGFIDGPRVIASMANDKWFPRRFAVLSDRLVTQNGILFMGISAILIIIITGGAVKILIVLYSINVFITFALSQAGMVKHWWQVRNEEKKWFTRLLINGIGFTLTLLILILVITMKFEEGGWITILITFLLIFLVTHVRKHYTLAETLIHRLDLKMLCFVKNLFANESQTPPKESIYQPNARTAVVCVNEFNGLGIKTFLKIKEQFKEYKNFIFIDVGVVDAGNFKGESELENLKKNVVINLAKYKRLANHYGFFAEGYSAIGIDVADEVKELSKKVVRKYKNCIFFSGQILFPGPTAFQRLLHNQTQLAIHNRLSHKGYIMVMIPIKLNTRLNGKIKNVDPSEIAEMI